MSIYVLLTLWGSGVRGVAAETDRTMAEIGSAIVTEKDFITELQKREYGLPGRFERPEQREALLEEIIRSELLYIAAIRDGYEKKPSVIEALKRTIINHYRQDNLEPVLAKISVTEDEIVAFYNDHTSEFSTPQMVRAAVIQISVPKKVPDELRAELLKKAEEARAEALTLESATLSFGSVAVKFSDDQVSRYRGGDTGLMKQGAYDTRWSKEVMDAIFSLTETGQVSPVIRGDDGYYLVKLMERKQSNVRPLKEVSELIRNKLFIERRSAAEKSFYNSLASTVKVNINRELLNAIESQSGGKRLEPPALPGNSR